MVFRVIIFLVINFSALVLGGFFTGKAVNEDWYLTLNKAPWTPPGWVFGVAWTIIMLCYTLYMTYLWENSNNTKQVLSLFILQWILNVSWNPAFFYFQNTVLGLIIIIGLTSVVTIFLINFWTNLQYKSLLIAPYFIWLLIATSLNTYIVIKN